MNRPRSDPATLAQTYVRPRRFTIEPALFALAGVMVVLGISAWHPLQAPVQQVAPTENSQTVAVAPRS